MKKFVVFVMTMFALACGGNSSLPPGSQDPNNNPPGANMTPPGDPTAPTDDAAPPMDDSGMQADTGSDSSDPCAKAPCDDAGKPDAGDTDAGACVAPKCVLTLDYWANHSPLPRVPLTIGWVSYDQSRLQYYLLLPANGDDSAI